MLYSVPKILLMGNLLELFWGMTWCITEMIHRPWDSCLNNMKKPEALLWVVSWLKENRFPPTES